MGALFMGVLAFTGGCQSSDSSSDFKSTTEVTNPIVNQEKKASLTLSLDLKAFKTQELSRTQNATEKIFGTLIAKNTDTNKSETLNMLIAIDDTNWNVVSKSTFVLDPGNYEFIMDFGTSSHQYIGRTVDVIKDGTNDVDMTIRPVIGETVTEVAVMERLPYFKLSYSEMNLTGFTDPKVKMSIDGQPEQIFAIRPEDGKGDRFFYITPGTHSIKLALFDGDVYKGKSIASEENPTIEAGKELSMSLQPLHGVTTFTMAHEGAEAKYSFQIPREVVEEAGGKENLKVNFTMEGPKNRPAQERELIVGDISGDFYLATLSTPLTNVKYDTVTIALNFFDTRETGDDQILGDCNATYELTKHPTPVQCDLTLRKRAIAGGKLMAVVGVNVYDSDKEMVKGAVLTDQSNDILGITGSGFGTDGFLKFLIPAGQHTIKATQNGRYGTVAITTNVFDIKNYTITLEEIYKSCKEIKASEPTATSGTYMIDPDGPEGANAPFEVQCDMETDGGGWTLVMKTSSTSAYTYSHEVWTNTAGGSTTAIDPAADQDYVSAAFYQLSGTESRLALGGTQHWNSWSHKQDTARNLSNQPRMQGYADQAGECPAQTNCGTEAIHLKPMGLQNAIATKTTTGYWHRFGYVNDTNDVYNWGTKTRVGWTSDINGSDTSDSIMGLGLECESNCSMDGNSITGTPHDRGSGYYFYSSHAQGELDGALPGWLWIR